MAEPTLTELDEIAEYIARDDSRAAKRYVQKVFRKVANLRRLPELGQVPEELRDFSHYREIVVAPCRIFYKISGDAVVILHVMRSERRFRPRTLLMRDDGGK
ncbi:MAG: toxin ParE1/3/4 [Rhodothermales bacterium]|jgi:toxin ParE1/3/4